jgi:hypothetical protein
MTRSPAAVAVAITVLVTASCGGKSPTKSAPPTTTVTATTTAPPATEAAVATTVAPKVPPTAAPTTTTTLSPKELAEAEVRAAWVDISRRSDRCYEAPSECTPQDFAIDPALTSYRAFVERELISLGRHGEPNPSDPSYVTVSGTVVFSADGLTATFDSCKWDTGVLYQDNPRVVVSGETATIRETVSLQRSEGRWMLAASQSAGPWVVGRNDCGSRP